MRLLCVNENQRLKTNHFILTPIFVILKETNFEKNVFVWLKIFSMSSSDSTSSYPATAVVVVFAVVLESML
jgi:hypothetical protein